MASTMAVRAMGESPGRGKATLAMIGWSVMLPEFPAAPDIA
jgi:hypothetical protein